MQNAKTKSGFIPTSDLVLMQEKLLTNLCMALDISISEKRDLITLIMIYGDNKLTLGKNSVK